MRREFNVFPSYTLLTVRYTLHNLYQTIRSCATWFLIYVVICIVRGFWLDKMKDVFFFAREIGVVENLARVLPDKKVWNKVQKLVNNACDVLKRIYVENTRIKRVRKMSGTKYCNRSDIYV